MIKKLAMAVMMLASAITVRAIDIPMNVNIVPDFGFATSTGFSQTFNIVHQGNNCKYTYPLSIYSNLGTHWQIKISALPLVSGDGKVTLDSNLVNYKIFGGESIATPSQTSNVWLPLPVNPTSIYLSSDNEMIADEVNFTIVIFVTPKTIQMQKTFRTTVKIEIAPI